LGGSVIYKKCGIGASACFGEEQTFYAPTGTSFDRMGSQNPLQAYTYLEFIIS